MTKYNLEFIEEPVYLHGSLPLRIGTDCSGIEAPIQALQQLGIPFIHEWSSDIDKYCIQSIKANYYPKRIYGDQDGFYPDGDITNRDHSTLPDIDLYVCGFPCQPFSDAGLRKGFNDRRGNVFWSCISVIRTKKPSYFILENVRGLLHHDKGNTWKVIWNEIQTLKDIGYTVQWKVLNTRHYGIPQNRERVYIVGTKKDFQWPDKLECKPISDYVELADTSTHPITKRHQQIIDKINKDKCFIDLAFGSSKNRLYSNAHLYCGCITSSSRIWCVPMTRYANVIELQSLQGIQNLHQVVSTTRLKKQIGNSMSVNIISQLLLKII
jgi:DNA (cytosine-5)-methyltransferase 1